MPRITTWPDIAFAADWRLATLSAATKAGRLRRIARGIYTPSRDPAEAVVRRNWIPVLVKHFPDAVIVDRSARAGSPDGQGHLYIDHRARRPLVLPGLTIVPRTGSGPLPGDQALGGFHLSSTARALLDNAAGTGARYLSQEELETWVAEIATRHGESRLNSLRDEARSLAAATGRQAAEVRLTSLISAALSTGSGGAVVTHALKASAAGHPYDLARHDLLRRCAEFLGQRAPASLPDLPAMRARRRFLPFYEAYFSNFIEGTEFTVDEAAEIVFADHVPAGRPADAHDIRGTYQLVADADEMRTVPHEPDSFLAIIKRRHATVMAGRPDKDPGRFKGRANRAGATIFVAPHLVEGTLRAGFDLAHSLIDPLARAVYMMFLTSEVHPFTDGNGRVARIMMNAELVAAGQVRIIIPTVFRTEYLSSLKAATNNGTFDALAAVLSFAQRYTAQVDFTSRAAAEHDLGRTNALVDPQAAEDNNIRLKLPGLLDRLAADPE